MLRIMFGIASTNHCRISFFKGIFLACCLNMVFDLKLTIHWKQVMTMSGDDSSCRLWLAMSNAATLTHRFSCYFPYDDIKPEEALAGKCPVVHIVSHLAHKEI
jgi:hypothetical protein